MDQDARSSNSFFSELKRRRVIMTCLLYVVLCWGVLLAGDILFPALGLDTDTAARIVLYLAVAGFPVTFALAWYLQITPGGIIRTRSFVERRVLSNLAPISDRRQPRDSTSSRKGEVPKSYQWILSAETGPLAGLSFGVSQSLVLGRALDCDIAVPSPHVSRNHARLELEGGKLIIEDLGSSNGTVVNGKSVSDSCELHHEDEVRFHDIVFRVTQSLS
jgi:hypothetical protein